MKEVSEIGTRCEDETADSCEIIVLMMGRKKSFSGFEDAACERNAFESKVLIRV